MLLGGGGFRILMWITEAEARLLIVDLGSRGRIGAGLRDEEQHGEDIMELNGRVGKMADG